jgi:hypothetical protein
VYIRGSANNIRAKFSYKHICFLIDHTTKCVRIILVFNIRGIHFLSAPVNRKFTLHSAIETLHFLTYFKIISVSFNSEPETSQILLSLRTENGRPQLVNQLYTTWPSIALYSNQLRGFSPRANYTDRATAACRQKLCQLLLIEGCRMVSAVDPLRP